MTNNTMSRMCGAKLYATTYANPLQWTYKDLQSGVLEYGEGKLPLEPGGQYPYPNFFPRNRKSTCINAKFTCREDGSRIPFRIDISGYEELPFDERFPGSLITKMPIGDSEVLKTISGGSEIEGITIGDLAPDEHTLISIMDPMFEILNNRFKPCKSKAENGIADTGTFKDILDTKSVKVPYGRVLLYTFVLHEMGLRPKIFADSETVLVGVPVRPSLDTYLPSRVVRMDPFHRYRMVLFDLSCESASEAVGHPDLFTDDDLAQICKCDPEVFLRGCS